MGACSSSAAAASPPPPVAAAAAGGGKSAGPQEVGRVGSPAEPPGVNVGAPASNVAAATNKAVLEASLGECL